MRATDKTPEIDNFLTSITGKDRKEVVASANCATCDTPNTDFRDTLSITEYQISGMCQDCQDATFGVD